MSDEKPYDVVIVGAGLAGSIIAYRLGLAGLKVMILEGGRDVPVDRQDYMERFYTQLARLPGPAVCTNPQTRLGRPYSISCPTRAGRIPPIRISIKASRRSPFPVRTNAGEAARPGTGWAPASDSYPMTSACAVAMVTGSTGRSITMTSVCRVRAGPQPTTMTRRPRSASRRTSRTSSITT